MPNATLSRMRNATAITVLGALAASLAGCGGSGATLEVTDAQGRPVRGALVVTTALDAGFVPLPVNDRTLAEMAMLERRDGGMTDAQGRLRVELFPDRAHLVDVSPPMWTDGETARSTWWLSKDARALERVEGDNGLVVRVAR